MDEVQSFISSRLDYCNNILYGCPSYSKIAICTKCRCSTYKPIVINMIILLPFLRNYTDFMLKKELLLKIYF